MKIIVLFNSQNMGEYTLDSYKYLNNNIELFNSLEKEIKSLGDDVERKLNKYYIVYRASTIFVDICPKKKSIDNNS